MAPPDLALRGSLYSIRSFWKTRAQIPITDLKRHGGKVLDELRQDRSPVIITEHGRAAAVLLDVASYEAMTRRFEILQGIEGGERDVAEGRTLSWDEAKAELRKWRR